MSILTYKRQFQIRKENKNEDNNSNPNKLSLTLLIGIAFRYHRYQCFFSQNHLIPNPAHHF